MKPWNERIYDLDEPIEMAWHTDRYKLEQKNNGNFAKEKFMIYNTLALLAVSAILKIALELGIIGG